MIAYVKGTLEIIETDACVVDVNGFGMRVFTPITEKLIRTGIGGEVKLYTYMSVREDAMLLYGFMDTESLELFKKLIMVTGVGPKLALTILSSISAKDLIVAIMTEDKKALTGVSGIGAKTAARILLDMKDKLPSMDLTELPASAGTDAAVTIGGNSSEKQEAIEALISLGFTKAESEKAVGKVYEQGLSSERLISLALKQLY